MDKIHESYLEFMKIEGANVDKKEELYLITEIKYGDKAWDVYEDMGYGYMSSKIRIGANFGPPQNVKIPGDDKINCLLKEVRSIINYCLISGGYFQSSDIKEPLSFPKKCDYCKFNDGVMSDLMENIIFPPENYHVLNSLEIGSYICTIDYVWFNATIQVDLFKNESRRVFERYYSNHHDGECYDEEDEGCFSDGECCFSDGECCFSDEEYQK